MEEVDLGQSRLVNASGELVQPSHCEQAFVFTHEELRMVCFGLRAGWSRLYRHGRTEESLEDVQKLQRSMAHAAGIRVEDPYPNKERPVKPA